MACHVRCRKLLEMAKRKKLEIIAKLDASELRPDIDEAGSTSSVTLSDIVTEHGRNSLDLATMALTKRLVETNGMPA